MHSFGQFEKPTSTYQYSPSVPCEPSRDFSDPLSSFIRQYSEHIRVFSGSKLPNRPNLPDGYEIVGIGDQGVRFAVREIRTAADAANMYEAYSSGGLLGLSYIAYDPKIKHALMEELEGIRSCHHNLELPLSIETIAIEPSGENGERWEMFPDPREQKMLKEMSAPELAQALWSSGSFIFGSALPDVARNLSVEKAIEICKSAIASFPDAKDAILTEVFNTKGIAEMWSTYDEKAIAHQYTPEQIERHASLARALNVFLVEHSR